ncbi:MAG: hypothetical protein PVF73_10075 [Bacteroidales bacterium]|jgi:hypothetical protein
MKRLLLLFLSLPACVFSSGQGCGVGYIFDIGWKSAGEAGLTGRLLYGSNSIT